jgi:NADH:ubiquinone oxidoreductase subunit 2 (subunit N)
MVAVALFYYLSVVRVMYFDAPGQGAPVPVPGASRAWLLLLMAGMLAAGFWQAPFFRLADAALGAFF